MKLFTEGLFIFLCLSYTGFTFSNVFPSNSNYPKNQSNEEYTLTEEDDDIRYFVDLTKRRSDSAEAFGLRVYKDFKDRFNHSKSNRDKSRLAFIADKLGEFYINHDTNNPTAAIKYFKYSIKLKSELSEKGRPFIYVKLGWAAFSGGRYSLTIKSARKALELSDQIKNKTNNELVVVLFAQNSIADTYGIIKEDESAIKYYEKAAVTARKSGSYYGEAMALNNIGILSEESGGSLVALSYFKRAIKLYYSEREEIIKSHSGHIARILCNISDQFIQLDQLDSANVYLNKAAEFSGIRNDKFSILDISTLRAELLFETKDYNLAKYYAEKGLNFIENQGFDEKMRIYEILMKIYEEQGDLAQTLKYSKLFEAFADSILNSERQHDLIAMNTKIELKKLDKTNQRRLNKKQTELTKVIDNSKISKQRLYILFGLLFLISGLFFWFWHERHKKKVSAKEQKAEREIKAHLEKILKLESMVNRELLNTKSLDAEMINRNMEDVFHAKLTKREIDVLFELSKGKNNSEIGETLFISINTVRTHLLKIYDKMEVKSRMEAVKKAENLSRQRV